VRSADYVIKRGFFAFVTIFVAITINFFLFRVLPGSAVSDLSRVPRASPKLQHALTVEFGLDKPKWQQYFIYLKELAHGNMGVSFAY
jgi:ABC-type dipeptide/oligopeptide/nickel transport system permease component